MKKILLIEDVKQFSLDMLRTVGDMKLIEEYIEKHSPGSLVAEFEARVMENKDGQYIVPFKNPPKITQKEVYVLILSDGA